MSVLIPIGLGICFGFILQRAGALEYETILKTLRLIDMRIAKFMFLAVGVSTIGIYSLRAMDIIHLKIIHFNLFGTVIGGLIFGIGFALSGYCPGTSIGAWAEGKKDAAYVILGGLFGVLGYTLVQPKLVDTLNNNNYSSMTLTDFIEINHVVLAVVYAVAIFIIVYMVNRIEANIQSKKTIKASSAPIAHENFSK